MGLRLQKSEQCQGCGINWWKNVTSPFRVSSREREYLLTLQSGCETEFLELCRVLFESWTGEVESLLMVFPLDLPRQKLALPSAKHSRRVLPGEPFLVLARAVFCHNWSAEAIPQEESKRERAFPDPHISTLVCHPAWKVNLKLRAVKHADLGLWCRLHFPVQENHLKRTVQIHRAQLNAGGEHIPPPLPPKNILCRASIPFPSASLFPVLLLSFFIRLQEQQVCWSLSNWQDWRTASDLNEEVLWDLCSDEALWTWSVFSSCSSFFRSIGLIARDTELGFWNWFCFSLRAVGKMRLCTLSGGRFVKRGFTVAGTGLE